MTRAELLDKLERIKKNSVIPDKQKQQLIELYNQKLAALGEPSGYQKELKRQVDAGEIEDTSKGISLYHLSENIRKKNEQPDNKVEETKPEGKQGRPSGSLTKPKASKPSSTPKAKKPKAKKKVAKLVEKKERPKKETTITVNGKEYNLEDCQEAIKAWKARKEQATKTQKKYKSKSPSVKAKENMEDVIGNITETIGKKAIENEPKQVVSALKMFKKKMDEAFNALGKVLSETEVKRLKSALNEIEEVIKGIEKKA